MSRTFVAWQGADEFSLKATTHNSAITSEVHSHVGRGGVEDVQSGVVAKLTKLSVAH